MSFGTMAVWQALALVGVAGVAAWLLFRIKVRPPRVQVPTLLLVAQGVRSPAER
jgi:hypothetical protein